MKPSLNDMWPTHGNPRKSNAEYLKELGVPTDLAVAKLEYIPGDVPPELKALEPKETILKPVNIEIEQDPSGGPLNLPGKKADAGKNLPWLFQTGFANALHEVSRVTTLGARKYTPGGWATVDNGVERYMEAFARHTSYLARSEVFDDGPGGLGPDIYHKASMIWNLLASLELELREKAK